MLTFDDGAEGQALFLVALLSQRLGRHLERESASARAQQ